ncbi:hypothetical protein Q5P01_000325 [Channa striata]|uniref:Uncharacterized protein n=1 Tax=Channa striata TaxID=64152 RepID=A0AA88IDP0_CHASR|nr:hypothetical protein Q5P01_000325 [Channa striata]
MNSRKSALLLSFQLNSPRSRHRCQRALAACAARVEVRHDGLRPGFRPEFYTDAPAAQSLASSPSSSSGSCWRSGETVEPRNPYVTGEDCATSELDDDTLAAATPGGREVSSNVPWRRLSLLRPLCYSAIELDELRVARDLDPERRDTRGQRAEDPIKAYRGRKKTLRASRPDAKGPGEPRAAGSRGVGSARSNR